MARSGATTQDVADLDPERTGEGALPALEGTRPVFDKRDARCEISALNVARGHTQAKPG